MENTGDYTWEKLDFAERIMRAVNRVPEPKRPAFELVMTGMLLAFDLGLPTSDRTAARPGA